MAAGKKKEYGEFGGKKMKKKGKVEEDKGEKRLKRASLRAKI